MYVFMFCPIRCLKYLLSERLRIAKNKKIAMCNSFCYNNTTIYDDASVDGGMMMIMIHFDVI